MGREGNIPNNVYRYIGSFDEICIPLKELNATYFKVLLMVPSFNYSAPL